MRRRLAQGLAGLVLLLYLLVLVAASGRRLVSVLGLQDQISDDKVSIESGAVARHLRAYWFGAMLDSIEVEQGGDRVIVLPPSMCYIFRWAWTNGNLDVLIVWLEPHAEFPGGCELPDGRRVQFHRMELHHYGVIVRGAVDQDVAVSVRDSQGTLVGSGRTNGVVPLPGPGRFEVHLDGSLGLQPTYVELHEQDGGVWKEIRLE